MAAACVYDSLRNKAAGFRLWSGEHQPALLVSVQIQDTEEDLMMMRVCDLSVFDVIVVPVRPHYA